MARKRSGPNEHGRDTTDWGSERTLADAEEEAAEHASEVTSPSNTLCACGSSEFLLEAYLQVVDGRPNPEPVEVESLTCPHCGREYEAVQAAEGRVVRGDFLGYVELE
jgi:hypothetical protein